MSSYTDLIDAAIFLFPVAATLAFAAVLALRSFHRFA